VIRRALAVWVVLIAAEILHGIARAVLLVPHVGQFRSNQIGVFTGSLIILVIALLFVRWIGASRTAQLLAVGALWLGLTLAFEFLFGHADSRILKGYYDGPASFQGGNGNPSA